MDAGNNRVQRFAPGATVADTVLSMAFNAPRGMRLDSMGDLYIADMNNHRVILYRCSKSSETAIFRVVFVFQYAFY